MNDLAPPVRKKRGRRPDAVLMALRTALLNLLERKQFEEISARDIIAEAGISPATFYRHYRTKTDLLDAVADEEIDTLVKMSASLWNSPREASIAQTRYLDSHRALWSLLLNGGAATYVREGFIRRLTQEYSDERWRSETWIPNELAIIFSVTASVEIISWWLRQNEPLPLETIAKMFDRLAIRPTLHEGAQEIAKIREREATPRNSR